MIFPAEIPRSCRVRDVAWLGAGVWSHFASSSVSRCESASPCILSALKANTFIPTCHAVDFQSSIPSLSPYLRAITSSQPHSLSQLVRCLLDVEDGSHFILPFTFVLDHSGYHQPQCPCSVIRLHTSHRLAYPRPQPVSRPSVSWRPARNGCRNAGSIRRCPSSAMHTTINSIRHPRILKLARILPKSLLALLADEDHVEGLRQRVISLLGVALCAVKPFLAWLP
jgi:hypothetical protein